ncbi:hypothetical protein ACFLU5_16870 [Bacteroidota bacterium]
MNNRRCIAGCQCTTSRRNFIKKSTFLAAGTLLMSNASLYAEERKVLIPKMQSFGPGASYVPEIKAAFVRRKEEYGMWWPGAVYDGEAAKKKYTEELSQTAKALNVKLDIRPEPIHSLEEADKWLGDAKSSQADGLMVMVLDRQQHSWPTAQKAADSGIPTVIFSPLGTSFTTNTIHLADKPGCIVYSTNDFGQAAYGMKMLKAGARMQHTRCVVIMGTERKETILADTGITLQYVPANTFIEIYNSMGANKDITNMAGEYINLAQEIRHASRQDVINGIKSYLVAAQIMENEKADAISMDCLGALGDKEVSLPCIAWSRMNDDGIPAACEADVGAIASHIMVQYLFDRPGFQQDPVADTSDDTIIGAHCSCPTRLNGFNNPPEPFELVHHHGNRDAVPRTIWKIGQRVTSLDVLPANETEKDRTQLLISTGSVVDNMKVPPSGGCVVSVKVKFDRGHEVLSFPGFHQLFFYGDYKNELEDFCKLYNFDATIA